MGYTRSFYNFMGWAYKEVEPCPRQKHLRHLLHRQIESSKLKLRKVKPTVNVYQDQPVKYVLPKKEVRVSDKVSYIPNTPYNSPTQLYNPDEHIQELKSLFKNGHKKKIQKDKKKKWGRRWEKRK